MHAMHIFWSDIEAGVRVQKALGNNSQPTSNKTCSAERQGSRKLSFILLPFANTTTQRHVMLTSHL